MIGIDTNILSFARVESADSKQLNHFQASFVGQTKARARPSWLKDHKGWGLTPLTPLTPSTSLFS